MSKKSLPKNTMLPKPMTDPWSCFFFTYMYHKKSTIHVGKYAMTMDPKGKLTAFFAYELISLVQD